MSHKLKKPSNLAFEDQFVDHKDRKDANMFRRNSSCPSLDDNKLKNIQGNGAPTKQLHVNKSDFYAEPSTPKPPNRDAILKLHMSKCKDDYTREQDFKIFIGSWNVNGQSICEDLYAWLGDYPTDSSRPADIVALGFQELDLRTEAYIFYESHREHEWLRACDACLRKVVDKYNKHYGALSNLRPRPPARTKRRDEVEVGVEATSPHEQHYERKDFPLDIKDSEVESLTPFSPYVKLHLVRLVGIMMVIFVKKDMLPHITDVASESIGTGLLGKMGNKGGVAIRFNLFGTPMCFVNTHFAAHPDELDRRNQDYQDISNKIQFSQCAYIGIPDHDYIFWFGDLNYRIDIANQENAKAQITNNQISDLMKFDQNMGRIFNNFTEGQITFPPTYKYDPGTDTFDTSEKARVPSWCDRILWKSHDASRLTLISYRSHPLMRLSDHKPVSALFNIRLQVIDEAKFKKAYEFVMKNIDRIENDYLPQAMLDALEVNFGDTFFMEHRTKSLRLTNVGQVKDVFKNYVPIQFQFIKKPGSRNYCKPWVSIKPFKYLGPHFVSPSDSCQIDFVCYVTKNQAPLLGSGKEKLEDILILHLENGKDFFISVVGNYVKSCFGASLEELVQKGNEPYRLAAEKPLIDIDDTYNSDPSKSAGLQAKHGLVTGVHGATFSFLDQTQHIPSELYIMIMQILERGIKEPELFQRPGKSSEMVLLRDSLDLGTPGIKECSVYSVCDGLLIFLEALQTPLFPVHMYDELIFLPEPVINEPPNAHNPTTTNHPHHQHRHHARMKPLPRTHQIMKEMPAINRDTFKFILTFLQCLLDYSSYNGLNYDIISSIFSRVLIREVAETMPPAKSLKTAPLPLNAQRHSTHSHSHNAQELSIQDQYILDKKRKALFLHLLMNSS